MNRTIRAFLGLSLALGISAERSFAGVEGLSAAGLSGFEKVLPSPFKSGALKKVRTAASTSDRLLDLLDDGDPAVRASAAKALKQYALSDFRVERRLTQLAEDGREPESVRREAIKSLAWAAQHYPVQHSLLALASDRSAGPGLRAIAMKSLYVVANRYEVKRPLSDALERDPEPEVRKAAAWALFADNLDYATQQALLRVATGSREEAATRVEALKSLLNAMQNYQVERDVRELAESSREDLSVREAAVLMLVMKNQDYGVQRFLEDLARSSAEPSLRQAAIKAMGGLTLELVRYFHLSHYQGKFIDPLEDQ